MQRRHSRYLHLEWMRIQEELADDLLYGPKDKRKKKAPDKTSDGKCPDSGTYGSSLGAARAAVASAKEALVALESEARRSGALAAWIR